MNNRGNPNFKAKFSGPTTVIRVPESYKDIILDIAIKLDSKRVGLNDLESYLDRYEQDVKDSLIRFMIDSTDLLEKSDQPSPYTVNADTLDLVVESAGLVGSVLDHAIKVTSNRFQDGVSPDIFKVIFEAIFYLVKEKIESNHKK